MSNETLNLMGIPTGIAATESIALVEPKTDRILMSDSLQGNVADLNEITSEHVSNFVVVSINVLKEGEEWGFAGSLRSIMHDSDTVELEIVTQLEESLKFLTDLEKLRFSFLLHPGDREIISCFKHPHHVKGCRLLDIDQQHEMCTLLLQLKPVND